MRLFTLSAAIALIAIACNQKSPSNSSSSSSAVPDIISENLKGKVAQVETDTYLIDSATGQKGKLESKSIEKYDDNGYTVYYSNYTTKDSATTESMYEHNPNGYMTGFTTTKNGKPVSSMKLTIDSAGKYQSAISYDSTGKEDVFYDNISANKYGEVLSAKGHHPDSSLKMTFTNNFDSVYYVGGESKDSVGKVTYSSTIKLNDNKDAAQVDETNVSKDSTTKTTTAYNYSGTDNNGNWTQATTTENGKPKKMIVRIITYKP